MKTQFSILFFICLAISFNSCEDGTQAALDASNAFMSEMVNKPTDFDKLAEHYKGIKNFSSIHKISKFEIGEATNKDGKIWVQTKNQYTSPQGEKIDRPFSLILEKNGADYEIVDSKGISDLQGMTAHGFAQKLGCITEQQSDQESLTVLKNIKPLYQEKFDAYSSDLSSKLKAGKLDLKNRKLEVSNMSSQPLKWLQYQVLFYNIEGTEIGNIKNLVSDEIPANTTKMVSIQLNNVPKSYKTSKVNILPYDYEVREYFDASNLEGISCPE